MNRENNSVFWISFCSTLLGGCYFGYKDQNVAMGIFMVAGLCCMAFSQIDKFKSFKGAGFEAELKETIHSKQNVEENIISRVIAKSETKSETKNITKAGENIHLNYEKLMSEMEMHNTTYTETEDFLRKQIEISTRDTSISSFGPPRPIQ